MGSELNDADAVKDLLGTRDKPAPPPRNVGPAGGRELWLPNGDQLTCLVCGNRGFTRREVLMNTAGMSYLNLDWANKAAEGAICRVCGFVHTFLEVEVTWR